ncbi:hypothetical protein NG798_26275 [Ancylothrix sp. C2]|uniref:hypothetical protein n=1 Tax=Ancylothrix sp. D3o TaxID=2953691 RepID=UPI0021BB4833|nr:hypothetical protein [Ancylothrix sp. D3o]MCT7953310.1 hypothetical protein [Ancylothrix sp. D3o]
METLAIVTDKIKKQDHAVSVRLGQLRPQIQEIAEREKRTVSSLARAMIEMAMEGWDLMPSSAMRPKLEKMAADEGLSLDSFYRIFLETSVEAWEILPSLPDLLKFKRLAAQLGRDGKELMAEAIEEKIENLLFKISPDFSAIQIDIERFSSVGELISFLLKKVGSVEVKEFAKTASLPIERVEEIFKAKQIKLSADEMIGLGRAFKIEPSVFLTLQERINKMDKKMGVL